MPPSAPEETEPAAEAPQRRSARRWLVIVLVALMALYFTWRLLLVGAVREEMDRIRAAGHPATPAELDAWYSDVPPEENAAEVLQQAFNRITLTGNGLRKKLPQLQKPGYAIALPAPGAPPAEARRSAIRQFVQQNEAALRLIHRGAAMPKARYPIDLSVGIGVSRPHSAGIAKGKALLQAKAMDHTVAGEFERAADSVRAMLGLAESLDEAPLIRPLMQRRRIQRNAVHVLRWLLSRGRLSDRVLKELSRALAAVEDPEALERALIGARAMNHDTFTGRFDKIAPLVGGMRHRRRFYLSRYSGLQQMDRLLYYRIVGEQIEAACKPLPQRMGAFRKIASRYVDPPFYALRTSGMGTETWPVKVCEKDTAAIAKLRAARTALTVERYRRANNALPGRLTKLTPRFLDAVPTDPFTGLPVEYQQHEEAYVVYSIGADSLDGGGKAPSGKKHYGTDGPDVTFTVKR